MTLLLMNMFNNLRDGDDSYFFFRWELIVDRFCSDSRRPAESGSSPKPRICQITFVMKE